MRNEVNNWQLVGFFILTYITKHNVLASLHKLTKQNTIQTKPFLLRDRKKVSISILFQKVFLGLLFQKLSPVINKQGVGTRMSWVEKNRNIN